MGMYEPCSPQVKMKHIVSAVCTVPSRRNQSSRGGAEVVWRAEVWIARHVTRNRTVAVFSANVLDAGVPEMVFL